MSGHPPLSAAVVMRARRLRRKGHKLSAIARALGRSVGGIHHYVRDIECPINHYALALRREVTLARQASRDPVSTQTGSDPRDVDFAEVEAGLAAARRALGLEP
jgi:hypothetical protein